MPIWKDQVRTVQTQQPANITSKLWRCVYPHQRWGRNDAPTAYNAHLQILHESDETSTDTELKALLQKLVLAGRKHTNHIPQAPKEVMTNVGSVRLKDLAVLIMEAYYFLLELLNLALAILSLMWSKTCRNTVCLVVYKLLQEAHSIHVMKKVLKQKQGN